MFIKHRRSATGWIAAALLAAPVIAGVVGAAASRQPRRRGP